MIIEALLTLACVLAVVGYVRTALGDFSDRRDMPPLLIAAILALGFIGLLLK